MNDKLATYLGFAIKSRNIVYGVDNIESNAARICMVLIDDTLATNSLNKLKNIALKSNIKLYRVVDTTLDMLLNSNNCKAIGLTSVGLANAIRELNVISEVRN